jgi:two-component system phosphate regulon sensor histidine kinase PhoR
VLVLQDMSSHYQALEMTRDFVANASHELKTPITIIRGFSETLQDNPDLSDEQVHFITGKIVSNTIRMTDLIGDLLHLSEIENIEHMELEECDLPLILGDCKAMILEVFPQADMTIESVGDAPFELLSSPQLLEHLFHNLLSNAAKYSEAPAKISIKVSRQGSKFMISIADNGMGIPKESLAHLFTRFYTVDKAHSKAKGGSGLGLAIVQTIVERVGGSISVESELHKGTTFTVILPERPC